MHRSVLAVALSLTAATSALAVDRIHFRQDFGPVQSSRNVNGQQTDIPQLYFEFGPAFADLATSDTGETNPLYEERNRGTNPLYNGDDRGAELAGQISSLSYELGPVTSGLSDGGIVHRDVAARNLLMQTDFGTYSTLDGEEYIFGSDSSPEYLAGGPVTWVTNSTIRLYLDGDESSGDYFEFIGTWFTDTAVPAPGATALLGLGGLMASRRRR